MVAMTAIHERSSSLTHFPTPAHTATLRAAQAWQAAGVVVIWLTSLFVAALWVAGGGLQATIGGGAEALISAGRLTGLVSANLLLYQVLLMARVPLFERAFGHDALTRAHRLTGFWSFWLFLAHVVLTVAGYAAGALIGFFDQLAQMVVQSVDMTLAVVATILIVGVVALSIRRARRRLRYESWHLLHLYAYLGVGLALPHQLFSGADFLAFPWAAAYWWALWAVAAGCVLVFRLGAPLARSIRHRIRVESVTPDGSTGVCVQMSGHRLDQLDVRAGQFFVWRFLDGPGWTRGHPFSISARPSDDRLTITARIVGDGTQRLTRMAPGTSVLVEGPYGHLTGDRRRGHKLLMLGAGAGVAPLVSILQEQPYEPGQATLVTRDSRPDEALLTTSIDQLVAQRGLTHVAMIGPRSRRTSSWLPRSWEQWTGPELLQQLAPGLSDYDIYLCGPGPWMRSLRNDLESLSVDPGHIHSEDFDI